MQISSATEVQKIVATIAARSLGENDVRAVCQQLSHDPKVKAVFIDMWASELCAVM